jgi:GNAT superfamily N-acetyltransferase
VSPDAIRIRDAVLRDRELLEALQRRASAIWEEYREQLAAHPDAIELSPAFVENGWVRIAALPDGTPVGFSVVIPGEGRVHELDGLFVEPDDMHHGIGTILVQDVFRRARGGGAEVIEVIAGPAQGFYEKLGFEVVASAETRFGPAVRMRRRL